jgi:hypothetical protein
MNNTHKKITIIDPDRWGLKYGEKRQWYYKMRLDFLSDPIVQGLNNHTKMVLLALISESLRENKHQISMCLDFIKHQLRVDLDVVKLSLRELKVNNIIEMESNVRTQLIEENRIEYNRTKQNKKVCSNAGASERYSFDLIYQEYPRKEGKTIGINKLKKIVKSKDQFNLILEASKKYNLYCKLNNTDRKYIKLFSTWVNGEHWNDELESDFHEIAPPPELTKEESDMFLLNLTRGFNE